ncbi:MAG TPA: CPBP family intramembrane glutamic endopeptidase, partial [Thermoanaerobaculia bacterium]|nr:CPBP family intramembrane glutamic endopeptidase [Thermoanaerobaculia bacterium]
MRSVATFFLLTFALAWAFFIAGVITGRQAIFTIGVFAPAAAGLLMTPRGERGALLRRVLQWRVRWTYYAIAIFLMSAIKLTTALLARVATGSWPKFGTTPFVILLIATLLSTPVQAGEEIGWRGYALPRLIERVGFTGGSIVLGVVWALWHIPQFFLPGAEAPIQWLPLFVIQVVAYSILLAWLYVRTNGSLLLTMLMHAAFNNMKDIVPSAGSPQLA